MWYIYLPSLLIKFRVVSLFVINQISIIYLLQNTGVLLSITSRVTVTVTVAVREAKRELEGGSFRCTCSSSVRFRQNWIIFFHLVNLLSSNVCLLLKVYIPFFLFFYRKGIYPEERDCEQSGLLRIGNWPVPFFYAIQ